VGKTPHRRTRTQRTQHGRPLRRYQRRWKIERLCRFQNFQRIVVRYERFAENFLGMLRLAAASFFCGGCEMASSLGGPPNRGFPAWASPA
jgi:hypothetical protein